MICMLLRLLSNLARVHVQAFIHLINKTYEEISNKPDFIIAQLG
jgi:hypothetical protein